MNIFHREHIDYLKVLISHKVEFILIGGIAVNYYGYHRPTGDLDVWLNTTDINKQRLINALNELQINVSDIELIVKSDFTKPLAFHIGNNPPFIIDFLTKIVGVTWNEAWEMKNEVDIESIKVSFIHMNHLKINKLISGRPKDLDDISKLTRIEMLRDKNK
jgi:predicted nucleotidyltransferase